MFLLSFRVPALCRFTVSRSPLATALAILPILRRFCLKDICTLRFFAPLRRARQPRSRARLSRRGAHPPLTSPNRPILLAAPSVAMLTEGAVRGGATGDRRVSDRLQGGRPCARTRAGAAVGHHVVRGLGRGGAAVVPAVGSSGRGRLALFVNVHAVLLGHVACGRDGQRASAKIRAAGRTHVASPWRRSLSQPWHELRSGRVRFSAEQPPRQRLALSIAPS